jgi:hypothetical protein
VNSASHPDGPAGAAGSVRFGMLPSNRHTASVHHNI